jgi:hypothetical protein
MRKITKRSAAIIGATVVAIGGGAAWAATSWFDGSGSARANSSTIKKVVAVATVAENLYPGKNADASVTVTNPNDYRVHITGANTPVVTVLGPAGSACTGADAKLKLGAVPENAFVDGKTAAGPGTGTGTWTGFIQMESDASAACAGAAFKVEFTLAGAVA